MSRTLEQIRTMAKRSANSERKPMSILNLNPIAALYVVRDYVQGMESRREFVERVDPDAVEPTPVADETVAAVNIAFDTNRDGAPRRMEKRDGGPFAYTALGTATDPATGKEYAVNVYEDRDGLIECVLYLNGRTVPESHKANVRDAAIEAYRAAFLRPEPVSADPVPVTPSHRPILDSDVEAAARGLQIARKSVGQLESLIAHHGKPEALFASHVIAEAARREIERRSEQRIIAHDALDGSTDEGERFLTADESAAAAELDRRSDEAESAFEARVEAWGGKSAFEYEARDPADGMTVHAYDLLCDQFFHLDDACSGDYAAAWERATSVLASCTRLDGNRYVVEPLLVDPTPADSAPSFAASLVDLSASLLTAFDAGQQVDASVALRAASGHMEKFGRDAWPDPTAALTRQAEMHCEFAVAHWQGKERARRRVDTKADARANAAHWQSIADTFGRLNGEALRSEPIQQVEAESVPACAPPVVERQDEPAADPCSIRTIGDFRRAVRRGAYAWPGGYPLYFILADGEALSFESAKRERRQVLEAMTGQGWGDMWTPVAVAINWEDPDLVCAHSGERIESAYGE